MGWIREAVFGNKKFSLTGVYVVHTLEVYVSVSSCDCFQKDTEDTEHWLTRVRVKEVRKERQVEWLRVVGERLKQREESADVRQGDQEMWALVTSERRELMQ